MDNLIKVLVRKYVAGWFLAWTSPLLNFFGSNGLMYGPILHSRPRAAWKTPPFVSSTLKGSAKISTNNSSNNIVKWRTTPITVWLLEVLNQYSKLELINIIIGYIPLQMSDTSYTLIQVSRIRVWCFVCIEQCMWDSLVL